MRHHRAGRQVAAEDGRGQVRRAHRRIHLVHLALEGGRRRDQDLHEPLPQPAAGQEQRPRLETLHHGRPHGRPRQRRDRLLLRLPAARLREQEPRRARLRRGRGQQGQVQAGRPRRQVRQGPRGPEGEHVHEGRRTRRRAAKIQNGGVYGPWAAI